MMRLADAPDHTERMRPLEPLLTLHQRHRFDPHGLTPTERAALRDGVTAWIEHDSAVRVTRGMSPLRARGDAND